MNCQRCLFIIKGPALSYGKYTHLCQHCKDVLVFWDKEGFL